MSLGRRFRKIIFIILIIGGFIFNPNKAFLYTANPTHFNLAKEMVEFYNLNYDPDINSRQLEMILKGSIDEDTSPRYAFHLYDPIYNRAPFGVVTAKIWALDSNFQGDVIHAFANLLLNIFTKDDGEFQKHGDYSWSASVKYYNKGDADKAYYGLGHILHLIADMSVPAHSRNDHHITGDPLESWAGGINFSSDYNANLAENLYKDKRRPEMIYSTGQVFDELAKYSNEYFFSKDSIIGTDLYRDYNQPHNTVIKEEDYGHFSQRLYAWGVDEYDNPIRLLRVDTQESNWREISLLEEEKTVYRIDSNDAKLQTDYWTHLAPKAVQYGAGVIKLFLDEIGKDVILSDSQEYFPGHLPQIASIVSPLPSQPEVKGVSTEREEIETDEENKTNESDGTDPSTELGTNPSTESGISESNEQSGTVVSGPSLGGDGWSAAAQNQTPETASTSETLEEPQDITPPDFSFDYLNYNYASSSLSIGWSSLEVDIVFDIEYKIGENDWQILMDNTASTQAILNITEKDKDYAFRIKAIDKIGNESNWQEKSIAIVSEPIIINEVAWAGTEADYNDEWIELYNRSDFEINLSDWMLKIDDAEIILSGILPSKNYFLLMERSDDEAILNIAADQIYVGALNNFGAHLILKDNNGNISDENNCGSGWCAGENKNEEGKWIRRTMERINPERSGLLPENWRTYEGPGIGALDKESNPILGTPKQQNSVYDINPPTVINDLVVDYVNGIFITLKWTAPLDKRTSESLSYNIRYSDNSITEENWSLTKPISDFAFSEKTPVVENPGTIQTVDITPLKFNTIYYFAIKTSDGLNIS
ncbi:MAG: lamin tail domain-containing protein, partial [Candidatus Omnitrophota bacterium]|nr:lamin tail domain-containing protein [Candidatus Omnitrophota bacterium]